MSSSVGSSILEIKSEVSNPQRFDKLYHILNLYISELSKYKDAIASSNVIEHVNQVDYVLIQESIDSDEVLCELKKLHNK
jgi:hypothetical protein